MTPQAEALRDFLEPVLAADFDFQFGRWEDTSPATRYAVLRPAGGVGAQLVRRPQFTLAMIGTRGGDVAEIGATANAVVERCRTDSGVSLVYVEAGEPVFTPTADGRPVFEIALSVIDN